ncbi:hemolysin XhlA family protein [Clostridioides difficile]|uniref:hemolysin XhlA family protein n=1 Tax=Clostridioides difficile TaxID=1496 RepID=UPI0010BB3C88|nr:hemolysin XhlA family protein [Clostridioides difficile]VHY35268.1 Uncharacterised protein [Clostridioides difficile]
MKEEFFKENLKRNEVTINKHNDEIDELKVANIDSKAELNALCDNLNSLISMPKCLIRTMISKILYICYSSRNILNY